MRWHHGLRRLGVVAVALVAVGPTVVGCSGGSGGDPAPKTVAVQPTATGECGDFTIAYDPGNGYEASAFIVGAIAADSLGCNVSYVKTTTRKAWRLVASGRADVYLDAFGDRRMRRRLTKPGGPVTVAGENGVAGVVEMLAPFFMGQHGLDTAHDLADVERIGWGIVTPAVTTVPALLPLAHAFVDFQRLDYVVRDYNQVGVTRGMGSLIQQARRDDAHNVPNVYLVEGPRGLLGDRPGQHAVDIPGSAAQPCQPSRQSTLCSFADFEYLKIANADFASSGNPAYALVYNYRLDPASVANILELIALSGYDVGPADVASWLNTHTKVWKRWLP